MIKVLPVIFFSIFYNFKNECCGTCCVDNDLELKRQFDDIKIEDNDILNKSDEKKGYSDLSDMSLAELTQKENITGDEKLNFNSIIKAKKYFKIFSDVCLSNLKEKDFESNFNKKYEKLIEKLKNDINKISSFNYDSSNNDHLVFESVLSFEKTKPKDFYDNFLSKSKEVKLFNIIMSAVKKKNDILLYFERAQNDSSLKLRKEKHNEKELELIYNSTDSSNEQYIFKIQKLEKDEHFKKIEFIFISYIKSKEFCILITKDKKKEIDELLKNQEDDKK